MPIVTGIEGIVPLKRHSPGTFIIMLTSYDSDSEIKMALQRGANGYLLKTSTPADIIRSIENVVEGGTPIDSHIAKKLMDAYIGGKHDDSNYHLSQREKEIVKLFAAGLSTEEIALKLYISYNTVNTHRRNIFTKLDVHSRHSLVAKAYKEGLID
jgi:DNA-binding NarL/FixJ family response regulator